MHHSLRRLAAASTAAAALGLGASAWAASPASAAVPVPVPAVPRCDAAQLHVTVHDTHEGGAGQSYYHIDFANISHSTCYLGGYPGVSAVDASGHQLGDDAARSDVRPPRYVDIGPGGTANAVLHEASPFNFPPGCKPAAAKDLRVYPPAFDTSVLASFDGYACSARGYRYLDVTRLAPGA